MNEEQSKESCPLKVALPSGMGTHCHHQQFVGTEQRTSVSTWQQIIVDKRTVCHRTKIPILALDGKSVSRILLVDKTLGLRTGMSCICGETVAFRKAARVQVRAVIILRE